jgi:hypothetical protein
MFAAELVSRHVTVIVAGSNNSAKVAQAATAEIPIVFCVGVSASSLPTIAHLRFHRPGFFQTTWGGFKRRRQPNTQESSVRFATHRQYSIAALKGYLCWVRQLEKSLSIAGKVVLSRFLRGKFGV